MNKKLLIKYINGEADEQERRSVIDWIDSCSANKEYFLELKNIWVDRNMPETKASAAELKAIIDKTAARQIAKTTGNMSGSAAVQNENILSENREQITRQKLLRYRCISAVSVAVAAVALLFLVLKPVTLFEKYEKIKSGMIEITLNDIPEEFRHTIYTEKGVKGYAKLPDSSEVWINSDTRLTVPVKFIGATREVYLEGEAYFKVFSDSLKPMVVRTSKDIHVKVKGTEFNLKSYANDNYVETTLYSGRIDLVYTDAGGEEKVRKIAPMEKAVLTAEKLDVVYQEKPENDSAWKEGALVFNATPMSEVIKQLERWYGVNVRVTDESVLKYPISATFTTETITQVMNMIRYCALVDYRLVDKNLEIFGRK